MVEQLGEQKLLSGHIGSVSDKKFGEVVQPIFITVDPIRDTVAQVEAYNRGIMSVYGCIASFQNSIPDYWDLQERR